MASVPPSKPKPRRDAGRPRGEPIEASLLARTIEEVAEHGLDGASVDRIAQAAEVNKTTIYRRFGTREGLIASALERVVVEVSAKLFDAGSLRKDLELVARHVASMLRSPMGQSLARAAFSESAGNEVAALAAREISKPRATALAMVERARSRGEWRTEVSPEVVLAALVGALLHRALLERAPLTAAFIRQVVDLVVRGVGTSQKRTR